MSLSARIWMRYRSSIFPKINHIRGSHRIHLILKKLVSTSMEKVDKSKTESVFEKGSWNNLIILDACRHDLYEEVEGTTSHRYTLGSSSREFIQRTFSDGVYNDTIVITANPHYEPELFSEITGREPDEVFHSVFHTYEDKWNKREGTVYPESILEDYKSAQKLFPDKRKLLHFMQPHIPFIYGDNLVEGGLNKDFREFHEDKIWDQASKGLIEREEVWEEYRRNLEGVLEVLKSNKEVFEGRTFITSDHGNFVGEEGLYGHPGNFEEKILRKVPWSDLNEI